MKKGTKNLKKYRKMKKVPKMLKCKQNAKINEKGTKNFTFTCY